MKMRLVIISALFFCMVGLFLSWQDTFTQSNQSGKIVISVKEGAHWRHSFRVMWLLKVTNQPQMAFWLEDVDGNYLSTLYITNRTALQDWRSSPGEKKNKIRRPSSLPVWTHQHQAGGLMVEATCSSCHNLHNAKEKNIDPNSELAAITGATPKTGFTREWQIPADVRPGKYIIKAEINHSKDFNNSFKEDAKDNDKNYSGGKWGSGQPSVVWQGELQIGNAPSQNSLKKIGHGHPAGKDGKIYSDSGTLDTALDIVESIVVKFE